VDLATESVTSDAGAGHPKESIMLAYQDPTAELEYRRERIAESMRAARHVERPHRRFRRLHHRPFTGR
jgi:hypothetical protein